ncbi:hypothetical protein EPI10_015143 [Gossypium australe]|uniref:Acidic leucine-rich nuclear phosphoprotein 32 family member B-like n=1 Tax=Gossypium australe TaxID=47621 RepID=A0A5B6VJT6_9ROSI|nr:hypothetical protein EPI10_015143 [Gossypium australe]
MRLMRFDFQHVKTECTQTRINVAELNEEMRNIVSVLNDMQRQMGTVNSKKPSNKEENEVETEDQNLDEPETEVHTERRSELVTKPENTPRSELVQKNVPFPSRLKDKQ